MPRTFLPKQATDPDRIAGIDEIMPDAVELSYIPAPLTESQLTDPGSAEIVNRGSGWRAA